MHNYSYGIMQANAIKGRQFSTALYYTYAIYTRANPKSEEFLIKEIFKLQMQDLIGFQI